MDVGNAYDQRHVSPACSLDWRCLSCLPLFHASLSAAVPFTASVPLPNDQRRFLHHCTLQRRSHHRRPIQQYHRQYLPEDRCQSPSSSQSPPMHHQKRHTRLFQLSKQKTDLFSETHALLCSWRVSNSRHSMNSFQLSQPKPILMSYSSPKITSLGVRTIHTMSMTVVSCVVTHLLTRLNV